MPSHVAESMQQAISDLEIRGMTFALMPFRLQSTVNRFAGK